MTVTTGTLLTRSTYGDGSELRAPAIGRRQVNAAALVAERCTHITDSHLARDPLPIGTTESGKPLLNVQAIEALAEPILPAGYGRV